MGNVIIMRVIRIKRKFKKPRRIPLDLYNINDVFEPDHIRNYNEYYTLSYLSRILHNKTATILFSCLFIKYFGALAQICGFFNKNI